MKRIKHLYEKIYDFDNLLQAYYMARKGKRYRDDVLIFTGRLEENLIELQNELIWKTYKVGRYREFFVKDPKKRLVMALPFRDRVIQCAIYRVLNPLLDKRYINTSYACRVGYGTHKSVSKAQCWLRKLSDTYDRVYVLKMDISKYFYRVNHNVLMSVLSRFIADRELLQLLEVIIRSETPFGLNLKDHEFSGERIDGIGMPIGNLTSQMFANLYLNEIDQYSKHQLRVRYYIRYMDDILILHHDKQSLWQYKNAINQFLEDHLYLSLNNKTCIRTIGQGVEFCGYRIWPYKIRMRKNTSLKMRRRLKHLVIKLKDGSLCWEKFNASYQSYLGTTKHCTSSGLRESLTSIVQKTKSSF